MKKNLLTTLFLLAFLCGHSQFFKWEVNLEKVEKMGFYDILVPSNITSKLHIDCGGIRIYDKNGEEVPYIFRREKPSSYKTLFEEYKIIENGHIAEKNYSRIVIHNPNKTEIDNISLIIRNSDVKKWLKLNGSDNNENWYVLKDNYYFQSIYSDKTTSEIRILNFPKSNYEYYELLISDYSDKPISVLKAGYYNTQIEAGKYSELAKPIVEQNDKTTKKTSVVKITFPHACYIDKLALDVEGARFYLRNSVINLKNKKPQNGILKTFYERVKAFTLSSNSDNIVYFDRYKAQEFYLMIDNKDDKPIKIKNVRAYQLNSYLTTNLNQGEQYVVRFGDALLQKPTYDLQYFKDSIPKNLQVIGVVGALLNISKNQVSGHNNGINFNPTFLWISIGIVVILLGFMSIKMIKEMKIKQS